MPLSDLTPPELLSTVARDYLANSKLTGSPLLGILADNVIQQKQHAIEWGAKVGVPSIGGRTVTGALSNDNQGAIKGASLSIPDYYFKSQVEVIKQHYVESQASGKIFDVKNPVRRHFIDAIDELCKKIESALFLGDGTLNTTSFGVIGLNTAVGDGATGSYAGLSRVTYPRWRSLVVAGTTPGTPEAYSVDKFSDFLTEREIRGATYQNTDGVDLVYVTNPVINNKILRKLYDTKVDFVADYNDVYKDILPYARHYVHGVPVLSDANCPANTMYALNLNTMSLYQFDQSDGDLLGGNPNIAYIPLKYTDVTGEQAKDSSLIVRVADVSDSHPDYIRIELTTRLQLAVFDLNDGVSKITDIHHSNVA